MRVLILATDTFLGLQGRQQRFARGLGERGHEVLYVNPPRAIRTLAQGEPEEGAGAAPSLVAPVRSDAALVPTPVGAGLQVIDMDFADRELESQAWTTRRAWKEWGLAVQQFVRALAQREGGQAPEVTLIYHPALLAPAGRALKGALVFDCLDDYPSLARSRPLAAAYEQALNEGLPHADGMLAVNRYLLESWGRLLAEGASRAVVEHGVDAQLFHPPVGERVAATRGALEIAPEQRMLCYLGRVDERLSYEDLGRLLDLDERAVLVFVGEVAPEGRDIFQRLPRERILPLGPVRPDRAADLVAAADLLIFPFRREPHLESVRGLKLYEYLATGLPVLATFRRTLKVFREVLYLYATQEEMEEGFRAALAEPVGDPRRAERVALGRAAAWERRLDELVAFLEPLATADRIR